MDQFKKITCIVRHFMIRAFAVFTCRRLPHRRPFRFETLQGCDETTIMKKNKPEVKKCFFVSMKKRRRRWQRQFERLNDCEIAQFEMGRDLAKAEKTNIIPGVGL